MTNDKIIERIEREAGIPGLAEKLAGITPTDLQSLLLAVYRRLTERRQPSAVLAEYESNRFVRPSSLSPLRLLDWERAAFAQLPPEFQPLALSPVCPLGTNSSVAAVDQNRIISTIRNTEVVSDSTNVLALEAGMRRRRLLSEDPKSKDEVHLAASHRLIRAQQYQNVNSVPHFSAFVLCSAGRDQGSLQFELATLRLHVGFYIRAVRAFWGKEAALRMTVTDFSPNDRQPLIQAQLFTPVQAEFGGVECAMDNERTGGRDYYADLCFHLHLVRPGGQLVELADGGAVNWTQRLLNNAKERCVISGIGSERVCQEFVVW